MTTFNTGNPVGSAAVKDLYDNAENLDAAINGPGLTWTDRLGVVRESWAGFKMAFDAFIADGSTIEFPTWAAASAAAAANQIPLNRQVAVIGDVGTHVDPVSGLTVSNSGRFLMVAAGLEWRSADVLTQKLDRSEFSAVVRQAPLGQLLVNITDQHGNSTWLQATKESGGPSELAVEHIRRAVPGLPFVGSRPGVLCGLFDATGRSTWLQASDKTGGLTDFATKCIRDALSIDPAGDLGYVCEGDSMTAGTYGGGESYPSKLSALLGVPVTSTGISGTTSIEVAVRAGGITPLITIPDGEIPAGTGAVSVTWNLTGPFSGSSQPSRVYTGRIRGVPVRITYVTSTGEVTLQRISAGDALPLASPVAFAMDTPRLAGNVHIVWVGRNDNPKSAAYSSIAAHLSRLERVGVPYLVLSVCNRSTESQGSSGYEEIIALNAQIQERAPLEYVDIRGRWIREGLAIAGVTPTSEDLAAIAADRIPPSLLFDGLHPNESGRIAIASIVHNELTIRGLTA